MRGVILMYAGGHCAFSIAVLTLQELRRLMLLLRTVLRFVLGFRAPCSNVTELDNASGRSLICD